MSLSRGRKICTQPFPSFTLAQRLLGILLGLLALLNSLPSFSNSITFARPLEMSYVTMTLIFWVLIQAILTSIRRSELLLRCDHFHNWLKILLGRILPALVSYAFIIALSFYNHARRQLRMSFSEASLAILLHALFLSLLFLTSVLAFTTLYIRMLSLKRTLVIFTVLRILQLQLSEVLLIHGESFLLPELVFPRFLFQSQNSSYKLTGLIHVPLLIVLLGRSLCRLSQDFKTGRHLRLTYVRDSARRLTVIGVVMHFQGTSIKLATLGFLLTLIYQCLSLQLSTHPNQLQYLALFSGPIHFALPGLGNFLWSTAYRYGPLWLLCDFISRGMREHVIYAVIRGETRTSYYNGLVKIAGATRILLFITQLLLTWIIGQPFGLKFNLRILYSIWITHLNLSLLDLGATYYFLVHPRTTKYRYLITILGLDLGAYILSTSLGKRGIWLSYLIPSSWGYPFQLFLEQENTVAKYLLGGMALLNILGMFYLYQRSLHEVKEMELTGSNA